MTDLDIINLVLLHEGGIYTDDPADIGGPTRWGVTIPVLAAFRRVPEMSIRALDIQALTREEAVNIYRFLYVQPFGLLPIGTLRANVIDMGVNAGVTTAARLLQQTVGATVDGAIGPRTIQLSSARDWNSVYVGVRVHYYERLVELKPVNIKWRGGWRNRALSFLAPMTRHMYQPRTMGERLQFRPRFGKTGKAYDFT